MRWTARAGVAALVVGVAAPAAWAATTWSPGPTADSKTGFVSGQYSWNYGSAASKVGSNKIAFAYASDAGTADSKESVYVRIGTVDPTTKAVTWAKPKLISPKTQIADRITLGSGKTNGNVYTTWADQTSYGKYDPAKPRATWYRGLVNGSWTKPKRLSSKTGRVDYPVVTGAGNNVYIAYTNADTGKVTLKLSSDAGTTFATKSLGTTTRDINDGEGLGGWPCVASDGANFAAAWLDGSGKIVVRVSEDSGATIAKKTITPTSDAGGDDEGWVQCDASGDRIGFTWNQDDGVYYAEYSTATDTFVTPATKAYALSDGTHDASYSGSIALSGTSTVGLAAPLCVQDGCDYTNNTTRIDLRWLESSNNGANWSAAESLSNSSVTGKFLNDSPSPIFFDDTTRFVIYNGWQANYKNYRLYMATGLS
jgi:hypothetical protein